MLNNPDHADVVGVGEDLFWGRVGVVLVVPGFDGEFTNREGTLTDITLIIKLDCVFFDGGCHSEHLEGTAWLKGAGN